MEDLQKLHEELHETASQNNEERARARALFLSIGDGAIAIDANGKIQQINQVAMDLLGFKEKEVLGAWFPKVLVAVSDDGELVNVLNRFVTQAILSGKPVTGRTNYLTKSGNLLPVSVTVSPIILNSKPIGAVEVFRDVTLENEVDRMKSEFISIASHQLRTPLTSIKTYTHLLSAGYEGKLTKGQTKFINIILKSVERMSELINILLDVSRMEAGKIEILLKKTDVSELILEVLKELAPEAKAKKLELNLDLPEKPIIAIIDHALTTEIVANLLTNAIKYTPKKGKIDLTVDKKPKEITIKVHDNGYGIPKSDQKRIFTKFFRAENAKQKEPSGTGLGLYMVKKIIENIGGKISFESAQGKGTTFFVSIPAENYEEKTKQKP